MKSKEEFRKKLNNGEFNEELKNINSEEEFVDFARSLGYDLTIEDIFNTKLSAEEMAMVAGGSDKPDQEDVEKAEAEAAKAREEAARLKGQNEALQAALEQAMAKPTYEIVGDNTRIADLNL